MGGQITILRFRPRVEKALRRLFLVVCLRLPVITAVCPFPTISTCRSRLPVSRGRCATGCQAVAQSIVDNGLEDITETADVAGVTARGYAGCARTTGPVRPCRIPEEFRRASWAQASARRRCCSRHHLRRLHRLNEQHVGKLPGVTAVDINYATRRARVRWDEARIKLSTSWLPLPPLVIGRIPMTPPRMRRYPAKERRDALWRLWVAGFGMMQVVMMYAHLCIADGDDGRCRALMRWASLFLTLPVVFYSSAPFLPQRLA